MHLHLFAGAASKGSRFRSSRDFINGRSASHRHNCRSLRKESFTLKIANALAKLAPDTLKLDVTTLP